MYNYFEVILNFCYFGLSKLKQKNNKESKMLEKVFTKAEEKRMKRNALILEKARELYKAGSKPFAIYNALAKECKCSFMTIQRVCVENIPEMYNK